ncbi:MFS transporter [Aspergillus stella-maris]|uniref:MFS transporter n=1 Tax=Aspergillus stella-maris TaxID=1810926 RepID=UPI003CCE3DEA
MPPESTDTTDTTETTPLLPPQPEHQPETPQLPQPQPEHPNANKIALLVFIVAITIDFGDYLSTAPRTQILENIICHNLHPDTATASDPNPPICKDADVQSELALINGWKETFDLLPGIILALPYGVMADRWGRKKVLLLSLLGLVLQEGCLRLICWNSNFIPPRAVWLTALFQTIGGGSQIATSMAFTIATDIFPVEKRTNAFFLFSSGALVADIVANPISAYLMTFSPWVPYLASMIVEVIGCLAALVVPETLPKTLHGEGDYSSSSDSLTDAEGLMEDNTETERASEAQTQKNSNSNSTLKKLLHPATTQLSRLKEFIWSDRNILSITIAFFTAYAAQQALPFMLQYVSKRFEWSMAKASILKSLKGSINLALLLILPTLSRLLSTKFSLPPLKRDLLITRLSALFLSLGFILMGLAPHIVPFIFGLSIMSLGWGYPSTLRSVSTALVHEHQVGLLNSTIALVQGVGGVLCMPMVAAVFRKGIMWGGAWMGMLFLVAGGLFAVSGGVISDGI